MNIYVKYANLIYMFLLGTSLLYISNMTNVTLFVSFLSGLCVEFVTLFLVEYFGRIFPVEVIFPSLKDYPLVGWIKNIPLY